MKVRTNKKVQKSQMLDYSTMFAGETGGRVIYCNPNRTQLIKLRSLENIATSVQDPVYTTTMNVSVYNPETKAYEKEEKEYTKLDLFIKIDPNKELGLEKDRYQTIVAPYTIFISNRIAFSWYQDTQFVELIDDRCLSARVDYVKGKTPKELLEQYQQYPDAKGDVHLMNSETVRFAKEGEAHLYKFLFTITNLYRHGTIISEVPVNIEGFQFIKDDGKSDAWEDIVNGDWSHINNFLYDKSLVYDSDNNPIEIGVMLYISPYSTNGEVKFYPKIHTSPYNMTMFRPMAKPKEVTTKDDQTFKTRLSRKALESLLYLRSIDKALFNDNFTFSVFDKDSYQGPETSIEDEIPAGDDIDSDDLPF